MRHLFLRLRARWRLWWGLCPHCDSQAPAMHICGVCQGFRWWVHGRPTPALKAVWWERYVRQVLRKER